METIKTKKNSTKKSKKRKPRLLDQVKIGKLLGQGMLGNVYLATDKAGNKYAYKIQKLKEEIVNKSFYSWFWRENDFAKNVAKKYHNQFIQLYDWQIENNCKGKNFGLLKAKRRKYNNPYCAIKLWSLIDDNIRNFLVSEKKISTKIFYDLYIQIVYIVYLINKHGYFHMDLHSGNIGYIKTSVKTINILGTLIPTHGYFIKAIDYGNVLHAKYKMNKQSKIIFNNFSDFYYILNYFSINLVNKEKIISKTDCEKYYIWDWNQQWEQYADITPKEENMLNDYLPESDLSESNEKFLRDKLFKLLHWDKWQKRVLNDNSIIPIEPTFMIPLEAILYLVKNIFDPEKVLKYLLENRRLNTNKNSDHQIL
jgi:serine/threonine protein kinase